MFFKFNFFYSSIRTISKQPLVFLANLKHLFSLSNTNGQALFRSTTYISLIFKEKKLTTKRQLAF